MRICGRILALALALLAVAACVSTGGREITDSRLSARLVEGKSTQAEVSGLLGLPTIVHYGPQGAETWEYYYITEYPQAIDFLPMVGAARPGFPQTTGMLTVTFDPKGVAHRLEYRQLAGRADKYPY